MAMHQWTLWDLNQDKSHRELVVSADDVPGTPPGWRVVLRTLHAGRSAGVRLVELDNGLLKTSIVPTRGMGIWRASMRGQELGWRSPVRGPVHPSFVELTDPSGVGWLSGFDELMCRCGLESNGAPDFDDRGKVLFPLHGRIANTPAYQLELMVDDVTGTIAIRGYVEESRFHFQKLRLETMYTTCFGTSRLDWHDEVENFGGSPAQMQMLYHTNIGQPLVGDGAMFVAPVDWVSPGNSDTVAMGIANWDRYSAPSAGFREQVYQMGLRSDPHGQTTVLIKNSVGTSAVQLGFNVRELPCFSLWRNLVSEADGYVTGIEPATNYPNPRSYEEAHGRVVNLAPGGKWRASLTLDWCHDHAAVKRAEQQITQLQAGRPPVAHSDILNRPSTTISAL